ncbi:hypothetical protein JOL79_22940 [Microbispora sp. RL4-1S]|uniref:Uncharacterized protein n=1 Tax=Microbispora oryzae TaxID=2806554 RepID=A0A940WJB2_9ACTN|nr:hypothetical protein [Microbispora oryzae]MBP2706670.1 hypothetical protein [Microbispora oryzae]
MAGGWSPAVLCLIGVSASAMLLAGAAPAPAGASTERSRPERAAARLRTDPPVGEENSTTGNGRRNHNVLSLRSPTRNRGYQHTSTNTAEGATSIQNALCRGSRVCNITQNVVIVAPTPQPAATPPQATPSPTAAPPQAAPPAVAHRLPLLHLTALLGL